MTHQPRRIAFLLVVSALIAAACAVPTDNAADVIPVDELPESLRPGFTATTTTIVAPITTNVPIFLLTRQAETTRVTVVAVQREVPFNPTIRDVIDRLFGDGSVTSEEDTLNYITTLSEFELLGASNVSSTAVIDIVNLTPEGLPSDQPYEGDLIEVVAQLVWTATEIEGITEVRILINGEQSIIPSDEGDTDVGATVNRSDYESFDPANEPPSTTTPSTTAPETTVPPVPSPESTTAAP